MAGDWIKLQKDTFDKPEVLAIATRMDIDPDAVVGKLCRIWAWFDTHTTHGNASCVTFSFVDRYVGVTGFAEQVALVGWLAQDGHDLRLPNFDYHNGETSKTRALGKNRAEKARSNARSNAPCVTKSLPEKRREEKSIREREVEPKSKFSDSFWKAWNRWKNHCIEKGKPIRATSEETQLMSLFGAYPNEVDAIAAIEHAITKNWSNVNLGGDHKRIEEPQQTQYSKRKTNGDLINDAINSIGSK